MGEREKRRAKVNTLLLSSLGAIINFNNSLAPLKRDRKEKKKTELVGCVRQLLLLLI